MNEKIKELTEKAEFMKKNFGFYYHLVVNDDINKQLIEIHTHNLLNAFDHIDLQIIITPNMTPEFVNNFLNEIIDEILSFSYVRNRKYTNNSSFSYNGQQIVTKTILDEYNRTLLRFIFPDENGLYPWDDDCDPLYKVQFTDVDSINNKKLSSM